MVKEPRIIQIISLTGCANLKGLGDDGVVYVEGHKDGSNYWEVSIPLVFKESDKVVEGENYFNILKEERTSTSTSTTLIPSTVLTNYRG